MSVLARKRNLSKYEFYKNAVCLRRQLTLLLLRDFGMKMVRNLTIRTEHMEPQDADLLIGVLEKYHLTKIPGEYPEWLVEKLRGEVWRHACDLVSHVTRAYTVWATNRAEAEERRLEQDRAISSCECLYKDLELALSVLPVKAEKYMPYVDLIEKEIALLKGWRKGDNRRNKK